MTKLDSSHAVPALEERHQRSIVVAVGQRAMQSTFVVRWDGLDPCLASSDINEWPRDYRVGLAFGLWFDPEDKLTLTTSSVHDALTVLDPVPDAGKDLDQWVDRIVAVRPPGALSGEWGVDYEAAQFVAARAPLRPVEERSALARLAANINPGTF